MNTPLTHDPADDDDDADWRIDQSEYTANAEASTTTERAASRVSRDARTEADKAATWIAALSDAMTERVVAPQTDSAVHGACVIAGAILLASTRIATDVHDATVKVAAAVETLSKSPPEQSSADPLACALAILIDTFAQGRVAQKGEKP